MSPPGAAALCTETPNRGDSWSNTEFGFIPSRVAHVSHFSKSVKVNRAHENSPAPAPHGPESAGPQHPCFRRSPGMERGSVTSGGRRWRKQTGDGKRSGFQILQNRRKVGVCPGANSFLQVLGAVPSPPSLTGLAETPMSIAPLSLVFLVLLEPATQHQSLVSLSSCEQEAFQAKVVWLCSSHPAAFLSPSPWVLPSPLLPLPPEGLVSTVY